MKSRRKKKQANSGNDGEVVLDRKLDVAKCTKSTGKK
jgi:hypothetical protein